MSLESSFERAPASNTDTRFWSRVRRVFDFETDVYEEVAVSPKVLPAILAVAVAATFGGSILTMLFFFVAIPAMVVVVGVSAFLVKIAASLLAGKSRSFGEWYRALAFAQTPAIVGLIPFVGTYIASVYCIATQVAVVARLADVSIRRAILTVLLAVFLPLLLLISLLIVSGTLAGLFDVLDSAMR